MMPQNALKQTHVSSQKELSIKGTHDLQIEMYPNKAKEKATYILTRIINSNVFITNIYVVEKGDKSRTTRPVGEKNRGLLIFNVHATYIISRF